MKAIIMAGGEGTRLRPVSAGKPKPMVELFDKPVLAHILDLLKANGFREACLTLKYMPEAITDYFGDGGRFGIRLDYRIETQALGTAGGVLNCADFIGRDDVLVISGDCVCDFDLKALVRFHRENAAEATLALYSHREPLEYGLVVTEENGRILRFTEKPAWDNVVTDQINTGIYVLAPTVLDKIPAGKPYDFGRDLFPRLLAEKRPLYGYPMAGYWCDIGNVGAYLQCCQDFLSGGLRLGGEVPQVKKGVWSWSGIPKGVDITPPVYIGRDVTIAAGAALGPGVVIGASSTIEPGAAVGRSVVNGATIGEGAVLQGAVVGRSAVIGRGCEINEGSAVGDGALLGDNCRIRPQAKIWPGVRVPAGAALSGCVERDCLQSRITFTRPGVIATGAGMSAETCLRLGAAAGALGRVGVSWYGGDGARVLGEAFGCGVNAAGGALFRHDGGFAACAAFAGRYFSLPLSVFFQDIERELSIYFFGPDGSAISREAERKFESTCDAAVIPACAFGTVTNVTGAAEAYAAAACAAAVQVLLSQGEPTGMAGVKRVLSGLTVAVTGNSPESRALRQALGLLGVTVAGKRSGIVCFEPLGGGMALKAADEKGYHIAPDKMQLITAFILLTSGVRELAVTGDTPEAVSDMADAFGATLVRAGRDGDRADKLLARQRALCDGVFAAVLIAAYLGARGETLTALRRFTPDFSSINKEVPVSGSRGAVMRGLSDACRELKADTSSGLRVETDKGVVHISPLRDRSAIRIRAESFRTEQAEELCAEFEKLAVEADEN